MLQKLLKKNIKGTEDEEEGDQSLEKTESETGPELDDEVDEKQNQAPGEENFVSIVFFVLRWGSFR